ncbi:MAG: SIMPL domain-containing protein [Bacteroides sp.]|nr:SIMPL domain-containing protein [Bacteroides sp.]
MEKMNSTKAIVSASIIAFSLVIVGMLIMKGLQSLSESRTVSVRGLAEMEVKADLVTWPIKYKAVGNDVKELHVDVKRASELIREFLVNKGVKTEDINVGEFKVLDRKTDGYYNAEKAERYQMTTTVLVKSNEVDKIREIMTRTDELIDKGVAISQRDYEDMDISYEYTGLNNIKPKMIEEATKNARNAAEQFAKDSNSEVGGIKTATQGYFEIRDRDSFSPHIKHIRVVTSVNYFLK